MGVNVKIAVCEDEIEVQKMLAESIQKVCPNAEILSYLSGEALLKADEQIDLVFLDIQLLQMDGVQVGKQVREQLGNEKISIVFISAKETYAMQLFQVRPLDFLIKPIAKARIFAVLETFLKVNADSRNAFQFQIGKSIYRQYLSEIRYFACNGRKIELYANCGCEVFYGTMQKVWQQVEGNNWF